MGGAPSQAESELRINVLGSLECWAGTRRIHLGGAVQTRVMAALLLESGQVLSISQLVDSVWDEDPPATATHQVRKAVARLRQLIPAGDEIILTESPGYRAVLPAEQVDVNIFLDLLDKAKKASEARRWDEAATHLEGALALRRGSVLAGAGGPVIRAADVALQERYLDAVEQLNELRLSRGESWKLVSELRERVVAHPLREKLRGQLMLALYRSGRQAEALEEYRKVHELLAEELGISPGGELSDLYQRMLRTDPALEPPVAGEPVVVATAEPEPVAEPTAAAVARTLPYDLPDFIGRESELRELLSYLDEPAGRGPRIVAIDGMGGVGKTSLAVRVAHLVADRYPDGQLYLNLRGYTAGAQPLPPGDAVETLLGMLGVGADQMSDDVEARSMLWRATTAQSRLLVLLDNAYDVAQVWPLLPLGPESLVLVTSRTRLIDLDGAHWMSLGTMTREDSAAMAAKLLGGRRTAAEPEAVAELVDLCGHLPLAMRIALSRLSNRPRWPIGYLVDRMSDESRRLDELKSGERGVELTLRISYEGLAPRLRWAFRVLGAHPGRDIDVNSAAALLGMSPEAAEGVLEVLLDAHMLQQHEIGYYTFHDLVRSFVNQFDLTGDDDGAADAFKRLLDYFVHATDHVCDQLFPGRVRLSPEPTDSTPALPALSTREAARQWLDREQTTLREAVVLAHARGLDRHVARLARNVVFPLDADGLYTEFVEVTRIAVVSSRRLGDPELLRLSLSNAAVAHWKLGRLGDGIAAASEALDLAVELDDQRGVAKDTGMLGLLMCTSGRFGDALSLLQESIRMKRELGAARTEAESLANLSSLYEQWGRYTEAAEAAEAAVVINRELGASENEIVALVDLALALLGMGALEQADEHLRRVRELGHDVGAPGDVALGYALSALVAHRMGRPGEARRFVEFGLQYHKARWTPIRRVVIGNMIGRLRRAEGDHAEALVLHERAHALAADIGYRIEQARALVGLAEASAALGEVEQARRHRERADEIFRDLGVPSAART
ncbi:DNA-binding SARP family transcriptional activator [Saccharothrix coeruleofusca]|uniref:AfsR/SARP family transcriptional regulator n=1 Tax=Saccharothrix coeruleofusca TaxID=33919 RepID=UPI001AE131A6|nr:AfsR/SARP family transcriptional regulator [Saccharothrix coeruleofusca]MBP2337327.1 DNA-binding SARP family transcriptional activator [Saccharothrix coeruleofusca]